MGRLSAIGMIAVLTTASWNGWARAGTLCGTVVDEASSDPVAEVGIVVLDSDGQVTEHAGVTDTEGRFCLEGVVPGTYQLTVEVDDYLTRTVRDVEVTDDPVEVRIGAGRSQVSMGPPWPNPGSSRVSFAYDLAAASEVRLCVYDARGRLIQAWSDAVAAGSHALEWDFTDAAGTEVASGLYFVRLETPDVTVMRPLLRMR